MHTGRLTPVGPHSLTRVQLLFTSVYDVPGSGVREMSKTRLLPIFMMKDIAVYFFDKPLSLMTKTHDFSWL